MKGTKDSYTIIDCVGVFDFSRHWHVCGVNSATVDHTLVRKADKCANADWSDTVGTNADDCEWIVEPKNTWTDVGQHTHTSPLGDTCEDINECDPNPCVHGTCTDGINSYTCDCVECNDELDSLCDTPGAVSYTHLTLPTIYSV